MDVIIQIQPFKTIVILMKLKMHKEVECAHKILNAEEKDHVLMDNVMVSTNVRSLITAAVSQKEKVKSAIIAMNAREQESVISMIGVKEKTCAMYQLQKSFKIVLVLNLLKKFQIMLNLNKELFTQTLPIFGNCLIVSLFYNYSLEYQSSLLNSFCFLFFIHISHPQIWFMVESSYVN